MNSSDKFQNYSTLSKPGFCVPSTMEFTTDAAKIGMLTFGSNS